MPIQFGSTKIGAMQYNGVTISEAMMDGQIVFRSYPYPLTGQWGPQEIGTGNHVMGTHEIKHDGRYRIVHTIPGGAGLAAIRSPNGEVIGSFGDPSVAEVVGTFAAGDVIEFVGAVLVGTPVVSGTWSIIEEPLPVVTLTGQGSGGSRDQFRAACTQYGVDYATMTELPFLLDTSASANLSNLFRDCAYLKTVPPMDTSNVTSFNYMFQGCWSITHVPDLHAATATSATYMFRYCEELTDGNVRLIGKHPNVTTTSMIQASGLTREPFYDTNGNPI